MLVRPSCIAARSMDNTVDRICSNIVPRIDGPAIIKRVPGQTVWIDGQESSIEHPVGPAAIQLARVDINPLFVFDGCAVWLSGSAWTREDPVGSVVGWRRQNPIVGDVIVNPSCPRRASGYHGR